MAAMEKEFFWGCELNKEKREYSWDSEDEELSKADIEQKLVVSQACLGAKAKSSEKNIVEVTTTDSSDSSVTHTILNLQSGRLDQCRLSLGFPSSVVFKLVEGSGPVHLTGSVYQELFIEQGEGEEDSDDDEEAPNLLNSEANSTSKKRPLPSETPKGPPKKLARVEDEEDESGEEEEDEDQDESSEEPVKMEVDKKDKQKKNAETTPKASTNKTEEKDAKAKKTKKDSVEEDESEEESEEDDEDEDEEEEEEEEDESGEDESEEEDDEDEEDESEEEDEIADSLVAKKKGGKPEQKKPLTNGVSKPGKKTAEEKEKPPKTAAKQQSTTKTGGKDAKKPAPKTPETLSMDQIKEKLKKTPSLPKKVDKFKNYMRSSFKMTDEGTVTKLWDWLQENRK
ncbi:unnamed protein product [Porites lobata]|uniref:Nucleophosmin n=1 Tax=Porites lobata TaxID=104759 RepID=A0ABN8NPK0_9CNID|nr:unnamed protein product [Porites lobata]